MKEPPPLTLCKREIKAAQPTLLDHAVIGNRRVMRRAVLRLGAVAMMGFRQTLNAQGFTEIQTPKIVESATESGANVFKLDYFGRPGYLAQSPQFYKQLLVGVFERVYEVGPVFRAEPLRGTELVTGGQRLHLYDDYLNALEKANLPVEPFETYLEAFRYGMPPHGGFAIGLERLIMQLVGLSSVKLATTFPRDINRLAP